MDCAAPPPLPYRLDGDGWARLDALAASGEHWDLLHPSTYARSTPLLEELALELRLERGTDPLMMLRDLNSRLFSTFAYAPESTRVRFADRRCAAGLARVFARTLRTS